MLRNGRVHVVPSPSATDLAKPWTKSLRHGGPARAFHFHEFNKKENNTKNIVPAERYFSEEEREYERERTISTRRPEEAPSVSSDFAKKVARRQELLMIVNTIEDEELCRDRLMRMLETTRAHTKTLDAELDRAKGGLSLRERLIERSAALEAEMTQSSQAQKALRAKLKRDSILNACRHLRALASRVALKWIARAFRRWQFEIIRQDHEEMLSTRTERLKCVHEAEKEVNEARHRNQILHFTESVDNVALEYARKVQDVMIEEKLQAARDRDRKRKSLVLRTKHWLWVRHRCDLLSSFCRWRTFASERACLELVRKLKQDHRRTIETLSRSHQDTLSKEKDRGETTAVRWEEKYKSLRNSSRKLLGKHDAMIQNHALESMRMILSSWQHKHMAAAWRQWSMVSVRAAHVKIMKERDIAHFEQLKSAHETKKILLRKAESSSAQATRIRRELAVHRVRSVLGRWRHVKLSAAFRRLSMVSLSNHHVSSLKTQRAYFESAMEESFRSEKKLLDRAESLHAEVERAKMKLAFGRCSVVIATWTHRAMSSAFRQWVLNANAHIQNEVRESMRSTHSTEIERTHSSYRSELRKQRRQSVSKLNEMMERERELREQATELHEKGKLMEQEVRLERVRTVVFRMTHRQLAAGFLRWVINTVKSRHSDQLQQEILRTSKKSDQLSRRQRELEEDLTDLRMGVKSSAEEFTAVEAKLILALRRHPAVQEWLFQREKDGDLGKLMSTLANLSRTNQPTPTTGVFREVIDEKDKSDAGEIVRKHRSIEPLDDPNEAVMNAAGSVLQVGDRVIAAEGVGYIRFVGEVHFKSGLWIGVELDFPLSTQAHSKQARRSCFCCDGSYQGRRYFSTNPNRGAFYRPWFVSLPEGPIYNKKLLTQDGWKKYTETETGNVYFYRSASSVSSARVRTPHKAKISTRRKAKNVRENVFELKTPHRPWPRHRLSIADAKDTSSGAVLSTSNASHLRVNLHAALDVFKQADIHDTGSLDAEEFVAAVRKTIDVSHQQALKLFAQYDRNDDKGISFVEFCAFLEMLLQEKRQETISKE